MVSSGMELWEWDLWNGTHFASVFYVPEPDSPIAYGDKITATLREGNAVDLQTDRQVKMFMFD